MPARKSRAKPFPPVADAAYGPYACNAPISVQPTINIQVDADVCAPGSCSRSSPCISSTTRNTISLAPNAKREPEEKGGRRGMDTDVRDRDERREDERGDPRDVGRPHARPRETEEADRFQGHGCHHPMSNHLKRKGSKREREDVLKRSHQSLDSGRTEPGSSRS